MPTRSEQIDALANLLLRGNRGLTANQAIAMAQDRLRNVKPVFDMPTKKSDNRACHDCGEVLGKAYKSYNDHRYCEQCYLELRQSCSWCDAKENNYSEFIDTIVEDNDKQTRVTLCQKCIGDLTHCQDDNCGVVFKDGNKLVCETCESQFCKLHVKSHNCKRGEPSYLWRNASRDRWMGDINSAQFIKSNRCVGIELEAVNGKPETLGNKIDHRLGISHDGSLHGNVPLEIQTPPATNDELEFMIDNATKALRGVGYKVNKSCGVHIHLDSSDFNQDANRIFHLLATYYAIEPVLFAMLPKSRRNNRYAQPLRNWIDEPRMMMMSRKPSWTIEMLESEWYKTRRSNEIDNYKHRTKYDSSRYHGFNLHALFKNGNIEYRYHHGTLNARKLINWINLHLAITEWALNNYKKGVVDAIFFALDPAAKLRIMVRHMGLSRDLRRYIIKNMKKFASVEEDND